MVIAGTSESRPNVDFAVPCEPAKPAVAVLEWRAWDGFLLNHVLGDAATRIETDPFSKFPDALFESVCETFKAVCFQVNLSVRDQLPLAIRELTYRFREQDVFVVNGVVQDVRKSKLHAHLEAIGLPSLRASQSGPADEILFVKTDLNYGGELERALPPTSIAASGLENLISTEIGPYRYKTVTREALDANLWADPAIVVEKFIKNSENSFYRVYFSGQQIIIVKAFSPGIIKKLAGDSRDTNYVTDLAHLKAGTDGLGISAKLKRDVATFVEHTPVEFGCLDMVHDGHDNHFVIDLNLTPYAGARANNSAFLTDFLRQGIMDPERRKGSGSLISPLAGS